MTQFKKNGIVIGGSSGVGAALVSRLHASFNLIIASRRGIATRDINAEKIQCDAREYDAVTQLFTKAPVDIDFVISCVGVGFYAPVNEDFSKYWKDILETNVIANVNILSNIKAHRPQCRQVIIIGSMAAKHPSITPGNQLYRASKVALETFLNDFRNEMRADGSRIKICNIVPGFIEGTDFGRRFFESSQQNKTDIYQGSKSLKADQVAEVIQWVIQSGGLIDITEIVVRPSS